MKTNRFDELFEAWSEGRLSSDESRELSQRLRESHEARQQFRQAATFHGLLHAAASSLAVDKAAASTLSIDYSFLARTWMSWLARQAIFGIVFGGLAGVLGVTAVWAYSSSLFRATSLPVRALFDGSFESDGLRVEDGFPLRLGVWSGDESIIIAREDSRRLADRHVLRFVAAMADAPAENGRAIACDVFQLVDIRSLRDPDVKQQDLVLELSADFLDDRAPNTMPSVTFFCQLYLFLGDPTAAHQRWPAMISEAVSSGSAHTTTLGSSEWTTVTSRCFVPKEADFAVVHIAAVPNLRVPMPSGLFVDGVRLDLKTQPVLPVRMARE